MKRLLLKRFRETDKALLIEITMFYGTNRFYKTVRTWVPKSCLEFKEVETISGIHQEEVVKDWFLEKKLDEINYMSFPVSWVEYEYETESETETKDEENKK